MKSIFIIMILMGLAALFPDIGKKGGWIHAPLLSQYGVFWVFFALGASLSTEKWKEGFHSGRFLGKIFIYQFLICPLFALLLIFGLGKGLEPSLAFAFFFLSVLPTTVSMSVVFSQKAGENPAIAGMASTLSNFLAVLIAPIWISLYLHQESFSVPLTHAWWALVQVVLLPATLGFLLRPKIGGYFEKHQRKISQINMGVIYFILYAAFCDACAFQFWTQMPLKDLGGLFIGVLLFLFGNHFILYQWGKRFLKSGRYTFLFSGAQKSLATGAPLAWAIVEQSQDRGYPLLAYGVLLLPFVIYHPAQMILGTLILSHRRH